jgi:uncharacterized LabA/DUF88 family protein
MNKNYFMIDGSALCSQIRQIWREDNEMRNRRLCPRQLIDYCMMNHSDLHGNSYKRAVFYFARGDETEIEKYIVLPNFKNPGEVRDLNIIFAGHKLKKSAEFDSFVEEKVPSKFQDRFQKSEKGIDLQICCDAFKLLTRSDVERFTILTNDGDFIPFLQTVKEFGCNVSLLNVSPYLNPNVALVREADSYDCLAEEHLGLVFESSLALVEDANGDTELEVEETSPAKAVAPTESADEHDIEGSSIKGNGGNELSEDSEKEPKN